MCRTRNLPPLRLETRPHGDRSIVDSLNGLRWVPPVCRQLDPWEEQHVLANQRPEPAPGDAALPILSPGGHCPEEVGRAREPCPDVRHHLPVLTVQRRPSDGFAFPMHQRGLPVGRPGAREVTHYQPHTVPRVQVVLPPGQWPLPHRGAELVADPRAGTCPHLVSGIPDPHT